MLSRAVAALAPGGRMVLFGSGGGTVPAEIPLAEAARAPEIIEARANLGKVVLRP